jgi:rubredoxin
VDFPILTLMDEPACYQMLLDLLHPDGLSCPRCAAGRDRYTVHRRREHSPVVDYRCKACRWVFNLFTGTAWQGTHRTPATILLILRGFAKGTATAGRCRTTTSRPTRCTRMRGKKGVPHRDPADPPRRRANRAAGHGTWDNDRPPVVGVVGRGSGQLRLRVARRSGAADLIPAVRAAARRGAAVSTDAWVGYARLRWDGYRHATVNHAAGEWARDDDGDGLREVHCNTLEGLWTGLRNFLRPFRGVNKVYLEQYIKMFEWSYNLKAVTDEFLRALLGGRPPAGGRAGQRPTTRSGT